MSAQQGGLIRFLISNFRGVVSLAAEPNGKSVTLRGRNAAGKSAAIDALWWALGGSLDGEVVRNGAERAEVELVIDGYAVRRQQARGKKPTLTVKSADGKATYNSPTALLAGFVAAVERRTFSARPEKERAETLRKLAPGLDCSDLDGERARAYEERTGVNRDAKALRAQADGVAVPAAPESIGEERAIVDAVDVADLVQRKADAAQQRNANENIRRMARGAREEAERVTRSVQTAAEAVAKARAALAEAEKVHGKAQLDEVHFHRHAAEQEARAAALEDVDTAEIDREIAAARETNKSARVEAEAHNRAVRAAQQQQAEHQRALAERAKLAQRAEAKEAEAKALTATIDKIDADRAARIAAANLPIVGIALGPDGVTFDDGAHGPVGIDALNSATRIKLDVAIAAALGHRLIAIRDASLLDAAGLAEVEAFARSHGVQLLAEIVSDTGDQVEAVIEGADVPAKPAQLALGDAPPPDLDDSL